MSSDEICVRTRTALRRRREKRMWRTGGIAAVNVDALAVLEAAGRLVPGTRRHDWDRYNQERRDHSAEIANRIIQTAEAVLSGSWPMLGHSFDLTGIIDWHRDPRTEYRWPQHFYAELPVYNLPDGVDVKYVWELGRQQYVVELARGWLLGGEERFAERARELILDWIEHNPLYEGIHWTSPLEAAMRAISWMWALATLAEWDGWQEGDVERIACSLVEHATYLEHHLEFYSSPYNHLIGEATALYLLGQALAPHRDADRRRMIGREVLQEHGRRQFYDDGFCVEQATGYHYYTLGFLTMAVAAARTAGEPMADLESVVHRAFRTGMVFRQPDGRWPAVGDVDSARSIPVHHEDFWKFDSLCAVAAVLFDDSELKILDSGPGEELFWLLAVDGVRKWLDLKSSHSSAKQVVLPDSGYAIASDGNDWLLFDVGPISAGLYADGTPSTAHGHADTLQVLYFTNGKPVLQDCGIPFYGGDPEWVRHFRSPAAHNTIEIDGVEFARSAGGLAWSHVSAQPQLEADFSDGVWTARGSVEWLNGAVRVEREVQYRPGRGLEITDRIESKEPRRVRWHWQLPCAAVCSDDDAGNHSYIINESAILQIHTNGGPVECRVETSSDRSPVARTAEQYGQLHGASRLVVEAAVAGMLTVVTSVSSTSCGSANPDKASNSNSRFETDKSPCLLQNR